MSFTRRYASGTAVNLTAPTISNKVFTEWLKDGVHHDYDAATSVTMSADSEMTARYFGYSYPCNTPQSVTSTSKVIDFLFNGGNQSFLTDISVTSDWSVEFSFPDYSNSTNHYGFFVALVNNPPADCTPVVIGGNRGFGMHITSGSGFSATGRIGANAYSVIGASLASDVIEIRCVANTVTHYRNGLLIGTIPWSHDGSTLYLMAGSYIGVANDRVRILTMTGL